MCKFKHHVTCFKSLGKKGILKIISWAREGSKGYLLKVYVDALVKRVKKEFSGISLWNEIVNLLLSTEMDLIKAFTIIFNHIMDTGTFYDSLNHVFDLMVKNKVLLSLSWTIEVVCKIPGYVIPVSAVKYMLLHALTKEELTFITYKLGKQQLHSSVLQIELPVLLEFANKLSSSKLNCELKYFEDNTSLIVPQYHSEHINETDLRCTLNKKRNICRQSDMEMSTQTNGNLLKNRQHLQKNENNGVESYVPLVTTPHKDTNKHKSSIKPEGGQKSATIMQSEFSIPATSQTMAVKDLNSTSSQAQPKKSNSRQQNTFLRSVSNEISQNSANSILSQRTENQNTGRSTFDSRIRESKSSQNEGEPQAICKPHSVPKSVTNGDSDSQNSISKGLPSCFPLEKKSCNDTGRSLDLHPMVEKNESINTSSNATSKFSLPVSEQDKFCKQMLSSRLSPELCSTLKQDDQSTFQNSRPVPPIEKRSYQSYQSSSSSSQLRGKDNIPFHMHSSVEKSNEHAASLSTRSHFTPKHSFHSKELPALLDLPPVNMRYPLPMPNNTENNGLQALHPSPPSERNNWGMFRESSAPPWIPAKFHSPHVQQTPSQVRYPQPYFPQITPYPMQGEAQRKLREVLQCDLAGVINRLDYWDNAVGQKKLIFEIYFHLKYDVQMPHREFEKIIRQTGKESLPIKEHVIISSVGVNLMFDFYEREDFMDAYHIYFILKENQIEPSLAQVLELQQMSACGVLLKCCQVCMRVDDLSEAAHILKSNGLLIPEPRYGRISCTPEDMAVRTKMCLKLMEKFMHGPSVEESAQFLMDILETQRKFEPIDVKKFCDPIMLKLLEKDCKTEAFNLYMLLEMERYCLEAPTCRWLLIMLVSMKRLIVAHRLYQAACYMRLYPMQNMNRPLNVKIFSYWRHEEIFMVLREYLHRLSQKAEEPGTKLDLSKLNLLIYIETISSPNLEATYPRILKEVDDSVDAAKERLVHVLQNWLNPPLSFEQLPQPRVLQIKPESLAAFLNVPLF